MKSLSKHQRGRAARNALMKAALAVFSRKGFEDTSIEEICLAAGYSKGGFYFHFRGKDDLLAQILEHDVDLARAGWLDALTVELWAGAARNRAVRERLDEREHARRRRFLDAALAGGQDPKSASRMLDLLLLLSAGLGVQQRFCPYPVDGAQRFVDSLLATLTAPATGMPERRRRAAS
jgi:AcrR family transcriptional regulator